MEIEKDKIYVKGDVIVICPECGLQFPVSIMDIVNEAEITCPAGKFTAHPEEHTTDKYCCCKTEDCTPKFEYHKFTLSKDKIRELF